MYQHNNFLSSSSSDLLNAINTVDENSYYKDGSKIMTGNINASGHNISCSNIDVSDTATINTLITNVELEVKDPLITCGVENTSDNLNLGLLQEYKDGVNSKWAGIVRSKDNKRQYLLDDLTSKPLPSSDITLLKKGILNAHSFQLGPNVDSAASVLTFKNNNSIISFAKESSNTGFLVQYDGGSDRLFIVGTQNRIFMDDANGEMKLLTNNLKIGQVGGSFYDIPTTVGSVGQILKVNATGDGLEWESESGGNLQNTYDVSSSPQITTTLTNPKMVVKQGNGLSNQIFELQKSSGDKIIGFNTDGIIDVMGLNAAIEFYDTTGIRQWEIVKSQLDQQLEFRDETGAVKLIIKQNGECIFLVDGNERLTVTPDGIETKWNTAQKYFIKDELSNTNKWSSNSNPTTNELEIHNENDILVQKTTQTGATIFKVGGVDKLDVNASGIIVDGVISGDTLESDNITVKKVGYKNNVGDDRFSQEWDATDKLITKNANGNNLSIVEQDGTTTFNVGGNEKFKIDSSGSDTVWSQANSFLLKDDLTSSITWVETTDPATFEKKVNNSGNQLVQKTTQTGEQKFLVSSNEVLNIDSTGLVVGDNLKTSSFVSEIRDNVPVIPSSIVWTVRPEYVGELSFSLGDTLVNFNSTVSQRSVESVNYAVLGKIPVGSSVNMSVQLNSVVGNDLMLGLQFTDGTEENVGSLVGRNKSQYYILVTKSGDLSKMVEAGVETVNANPNISAIAGDYTASLSRTSSTTWQLSFQQNLTVVSTVITFSGVEWASKQPHFLIGDRSNVPSSFNMLIQTTDSINYNATQELYTIEQKNNELTIFDESGVGLTSISSNVVKINKPLKTNNITTNDIDSKKIECNETAYKGLTPSASQLKLGGWDNTVSLFNTTVSGVNNKTVSFPVDVVKRSIPSKFFFIPNDIEVGGYCQYNIKTVATDHYFSLGVLFKDPQNYYFGVDTFNSVNHWWALLGAGLDYAYIRGQFAFNLTSVNLQPVANSIVKVRITRISSVEWRITYGIETTFTTEVISFGPELANKFCYATCCMFRVVAGSCTYELNDFEYNLWNPSTNNYSISQDTSNNLLITDNSNTKLVTINPNEYIVNTAVKTTSNMTINSNKFSNGAVVGGTFYTCIIGPPIVTGNIPWNLASPNVAAFGSLVIPKLSIGNIIKVKMSGLISTGGSDENFIVKVFWGNSLPVLGGILVADSDPAAKVLKNINNLYWELEFTLIPTVINFLNGTVDVRGYGMYRYNATLDNQKTYEGVSITDTGVAVTVPNVPTALNITGEWNLINPAFKLSILHCSYSYEGFNL